MFPQKTLILGSTIMESTKNMLIDSSECLYKIRNLWNKIPHWYNIYDIIKQENMIKDEGTKMKKILF